MKNDILACRINGDDVYFTRRPKELDYDGFIRRGDSDTPIRFWSYVTRFPDIEIIDEGDYLHQMWHGDSRSAEWTDEYLMHNGGSR